jgi:hypothetical protein
MTLTKLQAQNSGSLVDSVHYSRGKSVHYTTVDLMGATINLRKVATIIETQRSSNGYNLDARHDYATGQNLPKQPL